MIKRPRSPFLQKRNDNFPDNLTDTDEAVIFATYDTLDIKKRKKPGTTTFDVYYSGRSTNEMGVYSDGSSSGNKKWKP